MQVDEKPLCGNAAWVMPLLLSLLVTGGGMKQKLLNQGLFFMEYKQGYTFRLPN